jgi:cell division protease FtsH
VLNEAALLTVREGRQEIDQHTLEEAIDRVVAGPAKKHVLTEDERGSSRSTRPRTRS